MTTDQSRNYATRSLQVAEEMLADARLLLQHGRLKSAADRAYYAMFHAATAAVSLRVDRLPRSHKALRTLFAQHFIASGQLDRALSRDLAFAFELRQASSYEVDTAFGQETVQDLVDRVERFVATIQRLIASG